MERLNKGQPNISVASSILYKGLYKKEYVLFHAWKEDTWTIFTIKSVTYMFSLPADYFYYIYTALSLEYKGAVKQEEKKI